MRPWASGLSSELYSREAVLWTEQDLVWKVHGVVWPRVQEELGEWQPALPLARQPARLQPALWQPLEFPVLRYLQPSVFPASRDSPGRAKQAWQREEDPHFCGAPPLAHTQQSIGCACPGLQVAVTLRLWLCPRPRAASSAQSNAPPPRRSPLPDPGSSPCRSLAR